VASIEKPARFDEIIAYSKKARETFEKIRSARAGVSEASKVFDALIENCRVKNCRINSGYLRALGMKAP
jgi:hypothetical protein